MGSAPRSDSTVAGSAQLGQPPPASESPAPAITSTKRIGILLVHGIGEQGRNEHLESEAVRIVRALMADQARRMRITIRSGPGTLRDAIRSVWNDTGRAPVSVESSLGENATEIGFREVWWADLDDRVSVRSMSEFWSWALTVWTHPGQQTGLPGYHERMRAPRKGEQPASGVSFFGRAYLFLVSLVAVLSIPISWLLLSLRVLRLEFSNPLAAYLGDVKLYQDDKRVDRRMLEDYGYPPRVSVRRRMITELARMALDGYDYWYVVAHSLGTVVAFNGLMETEQALPAYLDDDLLAECERAGLLVDAPPRSSRELTFDEQSCMLPPRKLGYPPQRILARAKLFERLRGFLSYGSPLDKFCMLWPAVVAINSERERSSSEPPAFRDDMEWVNVYDPFDPVAGKLTHYDRAGAESFPSPNNVAYSTGWWRIHLLSHISYLELRPGSDSLVSAVVQWVLDPKATFQLAQLPQPWRAIRGMLKYALWLLMAVAAALVLSVIPHVSSQVEFKLFGFDLGPQLESMRAIPWPLLTAWWIGTGILLVLSIGLADRGARLLAQRLTTAQAPRDGSATARTGWSPRPRQRVIPAAVAGTAALLCSIYLLSNALHRYGHGSSTSSVSALVEEAPKRH